MWGPKDVGTVWNYWYDPSRRIQQHSFRKSSYLNNTEWKMGLLMSEMILAGKTLLTSPVWSCSLFKTFTFTCHLCFKWTESVHLTWWSWLSAYLLIRRWILTLVCMSFDLVWSTQVNVKTLFVKAQMQTTCILSGIYIFFYCFAL